MNSFSLDESTIESRTKTAMEKLDAVMRDLRIANSRVQKAIDEVSEHSEIRNINFDDLTDEIKDLELWKNKYLSFSYLASRYNTVVDKPFFKGQEAVLEELSQIRAEDIEVENNIGATSSSTSYVNTINGLESVETKYKKSKISFEDILSYGHISEKMNEEFEAFKIEAEKSGQPYTGSVQDYIDAIVTQGEFTYEIGWKANLSMVIDCIPIVGDAKGIVEGIIGTDLLTGRKLSGLERGLSFLSAIPLVGDGMTIAKAGTKATVKYGIKAGVEAGGKVFLKELGTNAAFMAGGMLCEEVGLPPYASLLIYQVGRVGYKGVNYKNITHQADIDLSRRQYGEKLKNSLISDSAWDKLTEHCDEIGVKHWELSNDVKQQLLSDYTDKILKDKDLMKVLNKKANNLLKLSDSRLKELMNSGYKADDYYRIANADKIARNADDYLSTLENTKLKEEWYNDFYGNDSKYVISYMAEKDYKQFVLDNGSIGRGGDKGGQFVLPEKVGKEIEKKLSKYGSIDSITDEFKVELAKELGLPQNCFDTGVVKVQIPLGEDINLRIVNGIEDGCNDQWIPGTKTLGGTREGIISQITKENNEELYNRVIENSIRH